MRSTGEHTSSVALAFNSPFHTNAPQTPSLAFSLSFFFLWGRSHRWYYGQTTPLFNTQISHRTQTEFRLRPLWTSPHPESLRSAAAVFTVCLWKGCEIDNLCLCGYLFRGWVNESESLWICWKLPERNPEAKKCYKNIFIQKNTLQFKVSKHSNKLLYQVKGDQNSLLLGDEYKCRSLEWQWPLPLIPPATHYCGCLKRK